MKHFLSFIILVFAGLFAFLYFRNNPDAGLDNKALLRVFASSSFVKQWGPGPWLKEKFEAQCDCRIQFVDAADTVTLIQRMKTEPRSTGADVVLGFDQYDLELAQKGMEWRAIKLEAVPFLESVKQTLSRSHFIPYDWGMIAFLGKASDFSQRPKSFSDLLAPELRGQVSIPDPRTSSLGLQFLLWLIQAKGEEEAFQYLQKFDGQVKSYGANWSTSYGLFQKALVKTSLSYVTSSVYHLLEEKNSEVVAFEFSEGHPIQYEFMGVPATCRNCELAERFVRFMLSPEGQKIIMEKNYMFPVIQNVREGTAFANIPKYKILDNTVIPTQVERERILKRWTQLRRAE